MNKRAFLEGFFTASTVAFGGHFMWRRLNGQGSLELSDSNSPALPQSGEAAPKGFAFTPMQVEEVAPLAGIPTPAPVAGLPMPTLATEDLSGQPSLPVSAGIEIASLSDDEVDAYLPLDSKEDVIKNLEEIIMRIYKVLNIDHATSKRTMFLSTSSIIRGDSSTSKSINIDLSFSADRM